MNEIIPWYNKQAKTILGIIKEFALLLRIYWIVDAWIDLFCGRSDIPSSHIMQQIKSQVYVINGPYEKWDKPI